MIEGTVENGRTANIIIMGMPKVAGIREHEGHLEVAYIGRPPTKFPETIVIDGVDMIATGAKGRAAKSFAVLTVVRPKTA